MAANVSRVRQTNKRIGSHCIGPTRLYRAGQCDDLRSLSGIAAQPSSGRAGRVNFAARRAIGVLPDSYFGGTAFGVPSFCCAVLTVLANVFQI